MKVLIPLEIPDDTDKLILEGAAESEGEIRYIDFTFNEQDLLLVKDLWDDNFGKFRTPP